MIIGTRSTSNYNNSKKNCSQRHQRRCLASFLMTTMMMMFLGNNSGTASLRRSSSARSGSALVVGVFRVAEAFTPVHHRSSRSLLSSSSISPQIRNNAAFSSTRLYQQSSARQQQQQQHATSKHTSSLSSRNKQPYSQATVQRLQNSGTAAEEFAKLGIKLQKSHQELASILSQRLAATDDGDVEKAEYMDWLLSGANTNNNNKDNNNNNGSSEKPNNSSNLNDKSSTTKRIISKMAKQQPQKFEPLTTALSSSSSKRTFSSNSSQQQQPQQTFATDVLFANRPDLSDNSKRAVAQMGLVSMTEIQDRTYPQIQQGKDVLGRARTGTGKTVAFLLPAIERLLALNNNNANNNRIGILAVSPTRELATQIGDQAEKLLEFHKGMTVQVMFGGTNSNRDITRLSKKLPTILVATPGRLLDHLQTARVGGNRHFGKDIMSQTPIVVLDETDRLLDMGFRREISKILGYLPTARERQTLLFSATIPPDLKVIMAQNMNKDYVEVDCINDGDAATHTNAQVKQSHVIVPTDRAVSSVVEVVRAALLQQQHDDDDTKKHQQPAKVVVFFPTARLVNFFAEIFSQGKFLSPQQMPVFELHSRKSQSYRNRVSEEFRAATRGVLFTSDVSARGVDYPNVSHVIQFGMPESREQYIHRLGRTGRGGTEGKGWLVLSEWETQFLHELKGVDIPANDDLADLISNPMTDESQKIMDEIRRRVRGGDQVLAPSASGAYRAFLGYYLGQMKRMKMKQKEELVEIANNFASLAGLYEPPSLTKMLVGKMGLKGVAGLNVGGGDNQNGNKNNRNQGGGRSGNGGGGRGGGGRGGNRR